MFPSPEPIERLFGALSLPAASSLLFGLGLCLILLQCLISVFNAILTQVIFVHHNNMTPFLMTYVGMSLCALLLPIHFLAEKWKNWKRQHCPSTSAEESTCHFVNLGCAPSFDSFEHELNGTKTYADLVEIAAKRTDKLLNDHTSTWNHRKHILAAIHIAVPMFLADYCFNASLMRTSIASATVLVSAQSIFVYAMAVVLRLESFSGWKLLGILIAVAGTALTVLNDKDTNIDNGSYYTTTIWWGDALAVFAAVVYATYTIQVRLFCPANENLYSMRLLLGYTGAVALILLAPVALGQLVVDQLSLSSFGLLAFKGLLDFLVTDYLLFRSIILVGPTVCTVGLGLSIPLAFVADLVLGSEDVFSWYSSIGAVACLVGFLVVNLVPDAMQNPESLDGSPNKGMSEEVWIL